MTTNFLNGMFGKVYVSKDKTREGVVLPWNIEI